MRIAITGATGNIGTSLIQALSEDGRVDSIVGIARRRARWRAPKTTWVPADVRTDDLVPAFRDADAVVHLAWIFQPTRDPAATWRNNALGSLRVFEATAEAGVPVLVYASSVGTYSPGPSDRAVDERWPTHSLPTAAYGREKAYVERGLDAFAAEHPKIRVVRLRPGFIFKRESASEQRRLFAGPLLPGALLRPELIPVVPDIGGLRFQALHSHDAAEAFRLAVMEDVRGAFNIAAEPVMDARRLGELLGARPVRVPAGAVRAAMAAAWHLRLLSASPWLLDLALRLPVMDTTRARTELGWRPSHSSMDAMGAFFQGLREGAGMDTPPLAPGGRPLRNIRLFGGRSRRGGPRRHGAATAGGGVVGGGGFEPP